MVKWVELFTSHREVVSRPWLLTANATSAARANYVPFSWLCLGEQPSRWGRDVKPWKTSRGLTPYHVPPSATHPTPKEILSRPYLGDSQGIMVVFSSSLHRAGYFPGRENMSWLGVPCSFPCCNKTYIGSFNMNKRHFGEFV